MSMKIKDFLYHLRTELRCKNERIDEIRRMYNIALIIHDERIAIKYENELKRLVHEADELVITIINIEKRVS